MSSPNSAQRIRLTRDLSANSKQPPSLLRRLLGDPAALTATFILAVVFSAAILGPIVLGQSSQAMNFAMRNAPPQLGGGWEYVLGGDNLGRSVLLRLIIGARTTLIIAASAVALSMAVGSALGLVAGYSGGWASDLIMRATDVIMSFPSLLTALIVLYLLGASPLNLVIVLAITRTPIYLRTVRAEVMEIRRRPFVAASRSMGAKSRWIIARHLFPIVLPTILTIGSVDFAAVIIAESGLSFLGLGIQPPDFTWGAMVATGRSYISVAWWLAFFPGLAITLTTLSLALLSNWGRLATDPNQSWRFSGSAKVENRE